MFISNRVKGKLIEVLQFYQEDINKLESEIKLIKADKGRNDELLKELQRQLGCGISHESDPLLVYSSPDPYQFCVITIPPEERCSVCGKVLRMFEDHESADKRRSELLLEKSERFRQKAEKLDPSLNPPGTKRKSV